MPLEVDRVHASLLREQVVESIRDAIVSMRVLPGERITERQLVESTGVSRATAREALRQLAAEGFVTAIPQRGVVVTAPTPREAADIYGARAVLEGLMGRLCARLATRQDIRDLRGDFAHLQTVLRSPDVRTSDMIAAKARFYATMFRIADNPTVVSLLGPLQAKITVLRATSMSRPGRPRAVVKEIRAIVDAVARHDEDGAFAACVAHIEHAAETAIESLTEAADRAAGSVTAPVAG